MFSGLFWTGEQALPLGLIDALGDKNTLRDAKYKDLKMIEYKRDRNTFERLIRDVGSETSASLRRALDLSEQVNPMQLK